MVVVAVAVVLVVEVRVVVVVAASCLVRIVMPQPFAEHTLPYKNEVFHTLYIYFAFSCVYVLCVHARAFVCAC